MPIRALYPTLPLRIGALLLAGTALTALAQPAAAQAVWDGSESEDWSEDGNWSTGILPPSNSTVSINNGTVTTQPVIAAGDVFNVRNVNVGAEGGTAPVLTVNGVLGLGEGPNGGTLNIASAANNLTGTVVVSGPNARIGPSAGATAGVALRVGASQGSTGLLEVRDGAVLTSISGSIGTVQGSNGTVTISGAGSQWVIASGAAGIQIGSLIAADARGTLNILDGAQVTYPGGVGWTLGEGGTLNVSGAGSRLGDDIAFTNARGNINVTDGGSADFLQLIGQSASSVTVSGTDSSLNADLFSMAQGNNSTGGSLLVEAGGQLSSNGFAFASNGTPADFDVTVQGAGSKWTINPGNSRLLGAGTNAVSFQVLGGGVVDDVTPSGNWSVGQGASVLISGEGSRWLTSGTVNFNATTAGQPVGDVIIENGGEFTVRSNGVSALGSLGGPVSRSLIVRSGGQVNFTGNTGAGLSVRNGSILVDDATLTGRLELFGEADRRTTVTVQGGGLIDGTGGGGWSADNESDFLVTGTNSRLIAVGAPTIGGDITVSDGGSASFEAVNFGATDRVSNLLVTGAGSVFSTRGLTNAVTFTPFSATRAQGASKAQIRIENGGNLMTGAFEITAADIVIAGEGSLWQIAADANSGGNLRLDSSLSITGGARVEYLTGFNPSFNADTDVLISGAGSTLDIAANISIGGGTAGDDGTFVIENGASLITRGPSDNGLGFNGVLRTVEITNGSSWIMTGSNAAGLQIETTRVLVDNSTLSAQGAVSIGLRFTGTDLILRNSDFTARALNIGSVGGNIVRIGTSADGSAGAAGAFNVGSVGLQAGNTLEINHTENELVLASTFAGAGTINHLAGSTRFTGGQAGFSGLLDVTGGAVAIDGALGGNTARATFEDATLSGTGSFGGDVTLGAARFAPGNSAGTFTIGGDLVLGAASVLDFELGAPTGTAGVDSDLITVGDDLVLDGTLNIIDIGGFGSGLYRLISFGGDITDNGLAFGSIPGGFSIDDLSIQITAASDGDVNLLVAAAAMPLNFWDGANTAANGVVDGGAGTWTATGTNWTSDTGTPNSFYGPAQMLIFAGTGGTVTLDDSAGAITTEGGLQFAVDGYTLTGSDLVLNANRAIIRVGDGTSAGAGITATIASAITGDQALEKTDLGTLILTGANSYSGGTIITHGTLVGNTTSLQGAIANNAALVFDQTADGTFAGIVSGTGALTKQGGARLLLTGANSYTGGTTIVAGTLAGSTASLQGDIVNNSALEFVQTTAGTFAGDISGSGALIKNGGGALTLTGANSYTGGTTVSGGSLVGNTASLQGDILNSATVEFAQSAAGTFAGKISGTGALLKSGAGALTLNGANSYTGGTTVSAGTLVGSTASLQGDISNNATVEFAQSVAGTFAGDISGSGALLKSGAGTLTLTGANSYTGGTFVSAGTLVGSTASLQGRIVNNAALEFAQSATGTFAGDISGTGALVKSGAGTLTLTGANSYTGGTRIDAGTLRGSSASVQGDITLIASDLVFDQASAGTFAGRVSGNGSLTKTGSGALTLTGSNDFGGSVIIEQGSLIAAIANLSPSASLAIEEDASLRLVQDANATFGQTISGTGTLIKEGTGALTLTAMGLEGFTFTGATEVRAGSLVLNGDAFGGIIALASGTRLSGTGSIGTVNLASGATLAPGSSIGTLGVTAASFAAGSRFIVELDDGGAQAGVNNDLIASSGDVSIAGGTVIVTAANGTDNGSTYAAGSTYTIITAAGPGGVSGAFDGVEDTFAFLDFTLGYDAAIVFLTSQLAATTFCITGSTDNQCAAGEGAFSLGGGSVFDALLQLSAAEAPQALDQLSGEVHASVGTAFIEDSRFPREAALGRIADAGAGAGGWAKGFGSWGQRDGDGNAGQIDRDIIGVMLGSDAALGENARIGVFGGYSRSTFDLAARGSAGSADTYHLGAYAGGRWGGFGVGLGAAMAWHDVSADRAIAFTGFSDAAQAQYDGRTRQLFGEMGYRFGNETTFAEPFAAIAVVNYKGEAFGEIGGAAALSVDEREVDSTFTTLGLRAKAVLGKGDDALQLRGSLGWRRAHGDRQSGSVGALTGGDDFAIAGVFVARDVAAVEAGFDWSVSDKAVIGFDYVGAFGSSLSDHGMQARLSIRF